MLRRIRQWEYRRAVGTHYGPIRMHRADTAAMRHGPRYEPDYGPHDEPDYGPRYEPDYGPCYELHCDPRCIAEPRSDARRTNESTTVTRSRI